MSKNKDAKRKAKIKAQKAQAIQQAQARNDRVAEEMKVSLPGNNKHPKQLLRII